MRAPSEPNSNEHNSLKANNYNSKHEKYPQIKAATRIKKKP
jgi:hypothetical protein